jgi:negative regulator of sigma E activity
MDNGMKDERSDAEIIQSALAQVAPKPVMENTMLLIVQGGASPVSFNGVIGEMDASGVLNGSEKRIAKVQVKLGTLQIENRAAEAEEMRRLEAFARHNLGF